jgi:hypothetical protein
MRRRVVGSRTLVAFGLFALPLALSTCRNSGADQTECLHPCDLAQTVQVEIGEPKAAKEVSVTGPCGGGRRCSSPTACSSVMVYLKDGSYSEDPVCHITVSYESGATVEADVVASLVGGQCCFGYQFRTTWLSLSPPLLDAGGSDTDTTDS